MKKIYFLLRPFCLAVFAFFLSYNSQGQAWNYVGSQEFSAGWAPDAVIAVDASGTPYVAYQDQANANKATVMKYNGSNWVVVGSAGFSAGQAGWIALSIDPTGVPYVAYVDYSISTSMPPATVMKYTGGSWATVGTAGFSGGAAAFTAMAIDASGTPYVAYTDSSHSNAATVK